MLTAEINIKLRNLKIILIRIMIVIIIISINMVTTTIILIMIILIIIIIAIQISRSVTDLALSLKSETNAVTISLIVPRKANLKNKAQEINSQLINMCGERDITFIDHTDTIDIERHLNKSKFHLNKPGTREFAKNICEFLLQQD